MLVSKSLNNFGGIFDFLRKFNELGSMLDARTSRLDSITGKYKNLTGVLGLIFVNLRQETQMLA